jgi:hypothetical protein
MEKAEPREYSRGLLSEVPKEIEKDCIQTSTKI